MNGDHVNEGDNRSWTLYMTADATPVTKGAIAGSTRRDIPRSASIIEAFGHLPNGDVSSQRLLAIAGDMAVHHRRQWAAEEISRADRASDIEVAASKRLIDALNGQRVALVEQIDAWIAEAAGAARPEVSLHTETLGSVVDRLAIAWVRSRYLSAMVERREQARVAMRQLSELAAAYDDLVRDVDAGRRRLPVWRPLKCYGNDA